MEHSKPGKKLSPLIARHTAAIYGANPQRYQNLCRWVWTQQRLNWPDEAIAKALEMAGPNIDHAGSWWKYLTALLPKAKGQAVAKESEDYKQFDLTSASSILRKIIGP